MPQSDDLYKVLDIRRNASPATIKKAHRRLVVKFHPDVKDGGDIDQFRRVDVAYKVLRDEEKRALYDETGTYSLASVQTEMQKVITVMAQLYDQLLDSGKAFDERVSIIDLMCKIVAENISRMKTDIIKIEGQITKLTDLRRTISRQDDGENLFVKATNRHLEAKRATLDLGRDQVHTLGLVQEELNNYSSFARAVRAVQTMWVVTNTSINISTSTTA